MEELTLDPRSVQGDTLDIGWPVGVEGAYRLVELPRPTSRGVKRIWVNKDDLVSDQAVRESAPIAVHGRSTCDEHFSSFGQPIKAMAVSSALHYARHDTCDGNWHWQHLWSSHAALVAVPCALSAA
jgi:hypothetical protein